jgi:TolA-binding protein
MIKHILGLGLLAAALALVGCTAGDGTGRTDGPHPVFGDGLADDSRVVARVNGEEITETMLDLRLEELSKEEKPRFAGEEGRRLLAHRMVEELLAVRDAEERNLALDPEVARVLNAQYRETMKIAHGNSLIEDLEPSVDQVRDYYEKNREKYVRLGAMEASHIECSTREKAEEAYQEIQKGRAFATVAAEYSENVITLGRKAVMGWFNKGGFIPGVQDSDQFSEQIWDLDLGVNEPIKFLDKWHVIKIHQRQPERLQTLDEAYARVSMELLPILQREAKDKWARQAREEAEVEFFGEFRPGHGKTAKELLERAYYASDPQRKADLLRLLISDYPDDEYTDDAMFAAGNHALDTWGDRRDAAFYFGALVKKFPDSEYAADAQYMLDNMFRKGFTQPESIEDLRGE